MKPFYLSLFLALVLGASSCVMTKTYTREEKKMVIPGEKAFVIKTTGEKITGRKISLPSVFNPNHSWIKLDGQKFIITDLAAYQDGKAYYINFQNSWAKQLKRGRINLFYYEVVTHNLGSASNYPAGRNDYHEHFVFQKDNGKLYELSLEGMHDWLKDNPQAQDKFDAQFKPGKVFLPKQLENHPKVLFGVIDLYNGTTAR